MLNLPLTGRKSPPLEAEIARPLTPADLAALSTERGTKAPDLKRITQRHHALARTLAAGIGTSEAALITGYTPSRVSILKDDPTFQELVTHYRTAVDGEYLSLHESLSALSSDATEELRGRLEENPADLTVANLIEVIKTAADRTGHGPSTTTNTTLTVNVAERMAAARTRLRDRVIDAEVIEEIQAE